jgi:putative hydrolase of the HAD superfamily
MIDTIMFDMGETLIEYYSREQFPGILREAISRVQGELKKNGVPTPDPDTAWQRAKRENHESKDHRVRLLEDRLARIFWIGPSKKHILPRLCRAFMGPIFALGSPYPDATPTLEEARSKGFRTAIVSNTPWGSPGDLWLEEIGRFGLLDLVDATVFCSDVGWRKPDRRIFEHTLDKLGADPGSCVFVGDDPRWDVVGPEAVGIRGILIQRDQGQDALDGSIRELSQLWGRI